MILVIVLVGLVGSVVLGAWLSFLRLGLPRRVTLGDETLSVAPTYAEFPAAVRLHSTFQRHLANARGAYVFGGDHLDIPDGAAARLRRPLALDRLPSFTLTAGLPQDSASLYLSYVAQLGAEKSAAAPNDFTVLIFGVRAGLLAPLCLVQVEQTERVAGDGTGYLVHRVRLWDADGVRDGYAYAEPAARRSAYVGAVHTWYRYEDTPGKSEEGPAFTMFPDPWLWSGVRGDVGETGAFTRFGYLVAVEP